MSLSFNLSYIEKGIEVVLYHITKLIQTVPMRHLLDYFSFYCSFERNWHQINLNFFGKEAGVEPLTSQSRIERANLSTITRAF